VRGGRAPAAARLDELARGARQVEAHHLRAPRTPSWRARACSALPCPYRGCLKLVQPAKASAQLGVFWRVLCWCSSAQKRRGLACHTRALPVQRCAGDSRTTRAQAVHYAEPAYKAVRLLCPSVHAGLLVTPRRSLYVTKAPHQDLCARPSAHARTPATPTAARAHAERAVQERASSGRCLL